MKKQKKGYKAYIPVLVLVAVDLVVIAMLPSISTTLLTNTANYFVEMLGVLPPVLLLMGLLDVWVSRETVTRFLGPEAGVRGPLLSIFLGALTVGPLYTAFPVAEVLHKKGTSYFNILVFLGAKSALEVPMFLFEMKALGVAFSVTRWLANLVVIFIVAVVMSRALPQEERYVRTPGEA